jgi:hypothetical protein
MRLAGKGKAPSLRQRRNILELVLPGRGRGLKGKIMGLASAETVIVSNLAGNGEQRQPASDAANVAGTLKDVLEIADTVATFVPGVGLAAKTAIKCAKEGCGLLEKCLNDENSGLEPTRQDEFIQRQMNTTDFRVAFNNFSPEFQTRVANMSPNAQEYRQGCTPYVNLPEEAQGQSVKNIGQQLIGFVKSIKLVLGVDAAHAVTEELASLTPHRADILPIDPSVFIPPRRSPVNSEEIESAPRTPEPNADARHFQNQPGPNNAEGQQQKPVPAPLLNVGIGDLAGDAYTMAKEAVRDIRSVLTFPLSFGNKAGADYRQSLKAVRVQLPGSRVRWINSRRAVAST